MSAAPRVATSPAEIEQFLAAAVQRSGFERTKVNLSDQQEWQVRDGALSHRSGGFFHVTGLTDRNSAEEHLVLFQPQGALTGLALCQTGGQMHVLLQARIEPGNSGIGQYGPTIQSTPANYRRVHGGKPTPYLDLFTSYHSRVRPVANSMQLDLGKRYFQKSKSHIYVEVPDLIETQANMIWVPLPLIAQALGRDNFINADLRSLLSVLDWDALRYSRALPVPRERPERLPSALIVGERPSAAAWEFTPLTQLKRWKLLDPGIVDIAGTGLSVSLYRISCAGREVNRWTQPLMQSRSRGLVTLLVRSRGAETEFLVSVASEFGISGGQTVLPSCVIYPGEDPEDDPGWAPASVVSAFVQCDEGGRFDRHESLYQLIRAPGDFEIADDQRWISVQTLKHLLQSSNTVSFQLRCIASLALEILNPLAFGNDAGTIK